MEIGDKVVAIVQKHNQPFAVRGSLEYFNRQNCLANIIDAAGNNWRCYISDLMLDTPESRCNIVDDLACDVNHLEKQIKLAEEWS